MRLLLPLEGLFCLSQRSTGTDLDRGCPEQSLERCQHQKSGREHSPTALYDWSPIFFAKKTYDPIDGTADQNNGTGCDE